jgi:arabinogalactan oligomer/maltooligosaccharide transport system permease protein
MLTRHGIAVTLFALLLSNTVAAEPVRLWHAYRGVEQTALEELVATFEEGGQAVELLSVPHDAYAAKLGAAVPLGDGPDLFIDAHERLGSYVERKLVAPVGDALETSDVDNFIATTIDAVTLDGVAYGVPLSQKSVALFYRTDLVARAPASVERMRDVLLRPLAEGSFLFAYETRFVYGHAAILHAFGGRLLNADDSFGFIGPEAEASLWWLKKLCDDGDIPREADGALVTRLFKAGKVAFAMNGPWLASDLEGGDVPYRVAVLPTLGGAPIRPLLTVEAVMLSPHGAARPEARALAKHLASKSAAEHRMRVARTVTARRDARAPEGDVLLDVFTKQAEQAVPMPASVAMRAVWEPSERAIRKVMRGTAPPAVALSEAKRRFDDVRRPLPPPVSPTPLIVCIGLLCLLAAFLLVRRAREQSFVAKFRESLPAYRWVAHAVISVGLLVFVPLIAGAALSLYAGPPGGQYYVGFANFIEILTARGGPLLASGSFYLVLIVTLLWTVLNISLHLSIGMALGVLLSRPSKKLPAMYRVQLIHPWAGPSKRPAPPSKFI